MKRSIMLFATLLIASAASAQHYYQDAKNPDITRHTLHNSSQRVEFVLPEVNGYTIYKADLHTHSIYSDGDCTPEFRVREAWYDGLDVLAITEHVEYRRHEGNMIKALGGILPEGTKAQNHNIINKAADERGIASDLNLPVELARKTAKGYGLTIISGVEITRTPETIGHYNALFTTDNNAIYDADPAESMRKARAQGALIMHNHPGWRRTSLEQTEAERGFYAAGLIDGVEVMNGSSFYPLAIDWAHEGKLFVSSNTDIHDATAETYRINGVRRNMTLIFAKDQSVESLREAIAARRTLAYSLGTLAGDEALLRDLFLASMQMRVVAEASNGVKTVALTNMSSVAYVLRYGSGNPVVINPFSTRTAKTNKEGVLRFTVENMWCGSDAQLKIEVRP
ncbi:MAG: histidinol-phosphatase [Rikenellaceae bacterium]|nr:histidinol-phosphatase [Rikenellaceae bacterium]